MLRVMWRAGLLVVLLVACEGQKAPERGVVGAERAAHASGPVVTEEGGAAEGVADEPVVADGAGVSGGAGAGQVFLRRLGELTLTEPSCLPAWEEDAVGLLRLALAAEPELRDAVAEAYLGSLGHRLELRVALGLLDPATHRGLREFLVATRFYRAADRELDFVETSSLTLAEDGRFVARLREVSHGDEEMGYHFGELVGTWDLQDHGPGQTVVVALNGQPMVLEGLTRLVPAPTPAATSLAEPLQHVVGYVWDLKAYTGELDCYTQLELAELEAITALDGQR